MKKIAELFDIYTQRWYYVREFNIFSGFADHGLTFNKNEAKPLTEQDVKKMKYHYGANVVFREIA